MYHNCEVGIDDQAECSKRLGLLGEGAYMVGCSSTRIEMGVVVIKLGKIERYDLVVYNGCTISPTYEHQIHGALEQHFGFGF
jgi:hypothetical protein